MHRLRRGASEPWKALSWPSIGQKWGCEVSPLQRTFCFLRGWQVAHHQRKSEHGYLNRQHGCENDHCGLTRKGLYHGVLKTAHGGLTGSSHWKTLDLINRSLTLTCVSMTENHSSDAILRIESQNWPRIPWKKKEREKLSAFEGGVCNNITSMCCKSSLLVFPRGT